MATVKNTLPSSLVLHIKGAALKIEAFGEVEVDDMKAFKEAAGVYIKAGDIAFVNNEKPHKQADPKEGKKEKPAGAADPKQTEAPKE